MNSTSQHCVIFTLHLDPYHIGLGTFEVNQHLDISQNFWWIYIRLVTNLQTNQTLVRLLVTYILPERL